MSPTASSTIGTGIPAYRPSTQPSSDITEPRPGSAPPPLTLELRERREDPEHEATRGGGGVDLRALADKYAQAYAAGGQVQDGIDEVGEVTTETVELPHHQHVVPSQGAKAVLKSGPIVAYPGGEVVVDAR
jgi:hypothetical protein